jgi:phosphoglycolate phosphatase-like HAD superfamily hydrolase
MRLGDDIEILRPDLPRGRFRAVLFDFDGTLSLIREGWQRVMTAMLVEELRATGTTESDKELAATVEAIVIGLNGKPTIVQMTRLVEEIERRGGQARSAAFFAHSYQSDLQAAMRDRYEDLKSGRVPPDTWAVPGARELLEHLRGRSLVLAVASGTDIMDVNNETRLLQLDQYFPRRIFAPFLNDATFSKRAAIERLLATHGLRGDELLAFGDGVVETAEVRRVGGVAVGVASHEPPRRGVNATKREQLIGAGADVIIPDFASHERLVAWLFDEV